MYSLLLKVQKVQGPLQKSRYIFSFYRWGKGHLEQRPRGTERGFFEGMCPSLTTRHLTHSKNVRCVRVSVRVCVALSCLQTTLGQTFPTSSGFPRVPGPRNGNHCTRGRRTPTEGIQTSKQVAVGENDIQRAEWCQAHHSSLPSQHSQNVDRHNTDSFPVHTVSTAGLEQNKISLWHKNLASPTSCVYISYYKLHVRILRRITISKHHF